jgi:uncharacterized membrane-anchored protein YhcB (DUF1043 family)
MEKSKKISRNLFLSIGVIVGVLIFLLGSQLTAKLSYTQKQEVEGEMKKDFNPIIKKFFS